MGLSLKSISESQLINYKNRLNQNNSTSLNAPVGSRLFNNFSSLVHDKIFIEKMQRVLASDSPELHIHITLTKKKVTVTNEDSGEKIEFAISQEKEMQRTSQIISNIFKSAIDSLKQGPQSNAYSPTSSSRSKIRKPAPSTPDHPTTVQKMIQREPLSSPLHSTEFRSKKRTLSKQRNNQSLFFNSSPSKSNSSSAEFNSLTTLSPRSSLYTTKSTLKSKTKRLPSPQPVSKKPSFFSRWFPSKKKNTFPAAQSTVKKPPVISSQRGLIDEEFDNRPFLSSSKEKNIRPKPPSPISAEWMPGSPRSIVLPKKQQEGAGNSHLQPFLSFKLVE